jgi:hypothetical protein
MELGMTDWYDRPRPSVRELARRAPLRLVLGEALRLAGAMALAALASEALLGPPPARRPGFQLAVLAGFGLIAGVMLLALARRGPRLPRRPVASDG